MICVYDGRCRSVHLHNTRRMSEEIRNPLIGDDCVLCDLTDDDDEFYK